MPGHGSITRNNWTGEILKTYRVDAFPAGIHFDGTSIWVANYAAGTVDKITRPAQ
jgi:hypothetical protein